MLALRKAGPDESLLPRFDRPEIRCSPRDGDVEVLPDATTALVRNVPAGSWKVSASAGAIADPGTITLSPGGHARIEVRLP